MGMRTRFAAVIVALTLAACATQLATSHWERITDGGEMFSAATWNEEVEAAVTSAGWMDRAEAIKSAMNKNQAWPAALKDGDQYYDPDQIGDYRTHEIARFSFHNQPAVLLHVPAAENSDLPEGWRPKQDFFIVIGANDVGRAAP